MRQTTRAGTFLLITFCAFLAGCSRRDAGRIVARDANATATGCPGDNAGLSLPAGFCATVFADGLYHARHIAVASNGDVYIALEGLVASTEASAHRPYSSFAALRDNDHDGRADVIRKVGEFGNTGIGLFAGYLYVDEGRTIVRYARADSQLVPVNREVVIRGIPLYPQHISRNFALGADSSLYLNVGSASNTCQVVDRQRGSPGRDECEELKTRAGVWRYRSTTLNQFFSPAERFATGLRNALGLAISPDGNLYALQHGVDQLHDNWPGIFPDSRYEDNNPAEELVVVDKGDDFGWPFCYYAVDLKKLINTPEYGGDGKTNSRCGDKKGPLVAFPAHWAPMSLMFYNGTAFPERYRHGAFVVFHGSWKRPIEPDSGYGRVVFQPLENGAPSGPFENFATGFSRDHDPHFPTALAFHRPMGLAASPDGSIFVSDDNGGRIYRITYRGR